MEDGKYGKWKVLIIHTGAGTSYRLFRGLSTWPKPMEGVDTGDVLTEIDTKKVHFFETETPKWWPQ